MTDKEFDQDAVKECVSFMEQFTKQGKLTGHKNGVALIRGISNICERHDIDKRDRVDFACEAVERSLDKQKVSVMSDFRETMEDLESLFL